MGAFEDNTITTEAKDKYWKWGVGDRNVKTKNILKTEKTRLCQ